MFYGSFSVRLGCLKMRKGFTFPEILRGDDDEECEEILQDGTKFTRILLPILNRHAPPKLKTPEPLIPKISNKLENKIKSAKESLLPQKSSETYLKYYGMCNHHSQSQYIIVISCNII